jgi:hypothetical protein
MPITNSPEVTAVAAYLRKEGRDATAMLIEMGMMQLAFDFRKRARSEGFDVPTQIDALAKFFASVIVSYAGDVNPPRLRPLIIASILSLVESHMSAAADGIMEENA